MASTDSPPQPDFITFLFSEKPKYDCFFIVGEKSLVTPERFGAIKWMLMAHSVVFRTELEDSELKEKGEVAVKDIYPDTFRTLLKFIYGFDTTGDLDFDEADNMFYAAEKYMMPHLKDKLAVRLITLLTPDNVCSLLNNPACATQLKLNSHITQILRYETDKVLASPQFLDVSPEGFLSILEQDGLAVPEIELWRAAMKWAKHRVDSEDGKVLRQQISQISKQLRICTVSSEQFCQEIAPADVLNGEEVAHVCQSIGKKRKVSELTEFSSEIEPRKKLHKNVSFRRWDTESSAEQEKHEHSIPYSVYSEPSYHVRQFSLTILTKDSAIELLPLVCSAVQWERLNREGWTYQLEIKVRITKVMVLPSICDDKSTLTLTLSKEVEYGKRFEIPLAVDGYNVVLNPNSRYDIEIDANGCSLKSYKTDTAKIHSSSHMVVQLNSGYTPVTGLFYKTVDGH